MKANRKASAIISICALVYFVSYFARKNFAAVMVAMIEEGVITKQMGGIIGMAMFILYGAGQVINGFLGDKIEPRILLVSGLFVTAMCNLLMPISSGVLMIVVWAVNGYAQSMLWPPIVRLLAENLSNEQFVKANLAVTICAHTATVLIYLYVPLCLELFDWKTVFYTATAVTIVGLAVLIVSLVTVFKKDAEKAEDAKEAVKPVAISTKNYISLLMSSGVALVCICVVSIGFLRDGIDSWLPTLYAEVFGRSASESVLVSVALPIVSILAGIVLTRLHKTKLFNNEVRGVAILFAVSTILCVLLTLMIGSDNAVIRMICIITAALISGLAHGNNLLCTSFIPGRFAKYGRAATTSGICNSTNYIGAAISMYAIAGVAEELGWLANIIMWGIVSLLGLLSSFLAYKSYSGFISEAEKPE